MASFSLNQRDEMRKKLMLKSHVYNAMNEKRYNPYIRPSSNENVNTTNIQNQLQGKYNLCVNIIILLDNLFFGLFLFHEWYF